MLTFLGAWLLSLHLTFSDLCSRPHPPPTFSSHLLYLMPMAFRVRSHTMGPPGFLHPTAFKNGLRLTSLDSAS